MNTRKKIINTLRSADKASVEKLMAEAAKKDEIFAKVMERAEKDNEYTDVAEGAEQYNRRMTIVHSASAAAASVLLVAGVWGAVHLLKSNKGLIDHRVGDNNITIDITDNNNNATADNTSKKAETTTTNVTSANGNVITSSNTATVSSDGTATENAGQTTGTTTTTTTNNNTVITTIAEAQQPEQNETAEQYREKCISAVYNYDRFSANYTFSKALNGSELIRYSEGKIKLDNSSMTGEFTQTKYGSNGNITSKENQHYLNDKYVEANDYGNRGGLEAKITKMSNELKSVNIYDKVYFEDYAGLNIFSKDNLNDTRWEVTGERYENGRKITSVKIYYNGEKSSTVIAADIDAKTGICLAYNKYENDVIIERLETSDYRFGEDAEIPMSSQEVKEFLVNNNYEEHINYNFSDYTLSDLE